MKITNLNSGYFYDVVLNEANVLNVKKNLEYVDPFSEEEREATPISIEGYLEHFLQYLGLPDTEKMFMNKMRKILLNDERYLHHVRKPEKGMPDWAIQGIKQRQLMFFKPEGELDDVIEHLVHYLGALEQDMKSPDNNVKAFATKEYQGFNKAQNLQVLAQKSQEYFKRGSKKASRSDEGLVEVWPAGKKDTGGWRWFLIKSAEAYEREGKVLQNCIGGRGGNALTYTPASMARAGEVICVLRKPNDESVIAARIHNKSHELREMKGKNNKPPIDKYMPYVLEWMNDEKFGIGDQAERDFRNAGYFYVQKQMYSRDDVIRKFIKNTVLAKLPDGRSLVEVKADSQNKYVKDIFSEVYRQLDVRGGYNQDPAVVYELRNDKDLPLVSGAVRDKRLESLQRHKTLTESKRLIESMVGGQATKEFIGELVRRKIITSINEEMARNIFWNERSVLNKTTGKFDPHLPKAEHETDQEDRKKITWEKHVDDKTVSVIRNSLTTSKGNTDKNKWTKLLPKKGSTVYITKNKIRDDEGDDYETLGKYYALLGNDKIDYFIPVEIHASSDRVSTKDVGNANNEYKRIKLIRAASALANAEGINLSTSFVYNSGLIRDKKGNYTEFDWKKHATKVEGDLPAVKIDLSSVPVEQRMSAINMVVVTGKIRYRGDEDEHDHDTKIHDHDTELQLRLDYKLKGDEYRRGFALWSQPSQDDTNNWDGFSPASMYKEFYHGTVPDRMFLVKVTYGKGKTHEVLMVATNNTIAEIDGVTDRHSYQSWGDHEKVAEQLNKFARDNGMKFHQDAVSGDDNYHIYKGHIGTEAMIEKWKSTGSIEMGDSPAADSAARIEFKDGSYAIELDPQEVKSMPNVKIKKGETAWGFQDDQVYLGVVVVKNGVIQNIYGEPGTTTKISGAGRFGRITPAFINYVLSAKKHFNWKASDSKEWTIAKKDPEYNDLKAAAEHKDVSGAEDRDVVQYGLAKPTGKKRDDKEKISITPLGKQALKKIESDGQVNILDLRGRAKVVTD